MGAAPSFTSCSWFTVKPDLQPWPHIGHSCEWRNTIVRQHPRIGHLHFRKPNEDAQCDVCTMVRGGQNCNPRRSLVAVEEPQGQIDIVGKRNYPLADWDRGPFDLGLSWRIYLGWLLLVSLHGQPVTRRFANSSCATAVRRLCDFWGLCISMMAYRQTLVMDPHRTPKLPFCDG